MKRSSTQMKNISPVEVLTPFRHVEWLLSRCDDKELLLAWVLGFRYCIGSRTARRLQVEDFLFQNGLPTGMFLRCGAGMEAHRVKRWYVPLRPEDRTVLKALLPSTGHLFSTADPFARLRRLAGRGNISLTLRSIRATCLANAQASGMYHEAVLELGQFKSERGRRPFVSLVTPKAAWKYWALSVNPADAAKLPRLLSQNRTGRKWYSAATKFS
jgi:hypothetical protein